MIFDPKELENILSDLRKNRRNARNELRRLPEGALRISKNGSHLTYLHITRPDGKRAARAIGRDPSLIYQLARKEYLMRQVRLLDHDIDVIEAAYKACLPVGPKSILSDMPAHFDSLEKDRILDRRLISVADWPVPRPSGVMPRPPIRRLEGMTPEEWAALPYKENTKAPEHKVHPNRRGLLCRSKSEVLITNEYDDLQIYYHYDEVIIINGYHLSPDVIGLASDMRLKYHEHAGLDSLEYRQRARFKRDLYEDAGIREGRDLIITFDTERGTLNVPLMRRTLMDAYLYR